MKRGIIAVEEFSETNDPNDLDFSSFESVISGDADEITSDLDMPVMAIDDLEGHQEITNIIATEGFGNCPGLAQVALRSYEVRLFGREINTVGVGAESITRVSIESKNIFVRVWDAIIKFLKNMWKKIQAFFGGDSKKKNQKKKKEVKNAKVDKTIKLLSKVPDSVVEEATSDDTDESIKLLSSGGGGKLTSYENELKLLSSDGVGKLTNEEKAIKLLSSGGGDKLTSEENEQVKDIVVAGRVLKAMRKEKNLFGYADGKLLGPKELLGEYLKNLHGNLKETSDEFNHYIKDVMMAAFTKLDNLHGDSGGEDTPMDVVVDLNIKRKAILKEFNDDIEEVLSKGVAGMVGKVSDGSDGVDLIKIGTLPKYKEIIKDKITSAWLKEQAINLLENKDTVVSRFDSIENVNDLLLKQGGVVNDLSTKLEKYKDMPLVGENTKKVGTILTTMAKNTIGMYQLILVLGKTGVDMINATHRIIMMADESSSK